MSTTSTHFIEALDVLVLRGNKLFGAAGSHGESLMPPWPSVAAGALRSALLVHRGHDLADFASGRIAVPELGTPERPGSFTLQGFHIGRRQGGRIAPVYQLPADLAVTRLDDDTLGLRAMQPTRLVGVQTGAPLPRVPVLAETTRGKPETGYWLTAEGMTRWLQGAVPTADQLVHSQDLWGYEDRIGIGMDPNLKRAQDGRLFTSRVVALRPGVGFVAEVSGCPWPAALTLRFGGDGRGAVSHATDAQWPKADPAAIVTSGRARLLLTSPGYFADGGWYPTGVHHDAASGELRFDLHGVRGRLVAAGVSRAEVISGWDLAKRQPKPAERVAPTGSVYWLDQLEASPQALDKLVMRGLWTDTHYDDQPRRAEGFNRCLIAPWLRTP